MITLQHPLSSLVRFRGERPGGLPLDSSGPPASGGLGNKVPHVTLAFWVMKIAATTLGETAGDLLSMTLNVGYLFSSLLLLTVFALTLGAQIKARRFYPPLYWAVILSTSTAGTTMSDYMDRSLGLGYATGSTLLVTTLIILLATWKWTVGSLAVDNVRTLRVELFYWAAILVSNTLGTAFGDFLADDSGLGFGGGAALIGGVIVLVALAYALTDLPKSMLFWAAFVLTRPLGATAGDLLTKTPQQGGLGFGTIGASLVLSAILVGMIFSTMRGRPRDNPPTV